MVQRVGALDVLLARIISLVRSLMFLDAAVNLAALELVFLEASIISVCYMTCILLIGPVFLVVRSSPRNGLVSVAF